VGEAQLAATAAAASPRFALGRGVGGHHLKRTVSSAGAAVPR
jgi:hypothetical protein